MPINVYKRCESSHLVMQEHLHEKWTGSGKGLHQSFHFPWMCLCARTCNFLLYFTQVQMS